MIYKNDGYAELIIQSWTFLLTGCNGHTGSTSKKKPIVSIHTAGNIRAQSSNQIPLTKRVISQHAGSSKFFYWSMQLKKLRV